MAVVLSGTSSDDVSRNNIKTPCSECEKVGRAFYLIESGVASVIVADCDGQAQLVPGKLMSQFLSINSILL